MGMEHAIEEETRDGRARSGLVMKKSRLKRLMLSVAMLALAGCNSRHAETQLPVQPEVKAAPATPIAEKKEELGKASWDPQWDAVIEKALPPEMLSSRMERAVKPFCPRFNSLSEVDRRAYWAYFFQALAGAEAGLVPTTDVRHTEPEVAVKDTVTKRMVRSEGLLQLTYMDADRYGCDFDWEKDRQLSEKDPAKTILQPANNLTCGIKILDNQLINRGKPLVSSASYWSTLQPGTVSYRVFVKQMQNVPEVCRALPAHRRRDRAIDASKSVASETASDAGTN
jgi:hypothetical protein